MGDQRYDLIYGADNSDAVRKAGQYIGLLKKLDAVAQKLPKTLKAAFSAGGSNAATKGINAASAATVAFIGKLNALVRALSLVGTKATAVRAALQNLFQPSSRAASTAARNAEKHARALQNVATQAAAASTSLTGVASAAQQAGASTRISVRSSNSLGMSFGRLGAAMLALRAGHVLLEAIRDALKEAREYAAEVGKEVLGVRDAVRELAAVRGGKLSTAQVADEVLKLRAVSGMKESEAIDFDVMWESAISAAKKTGNWELNDDETAKAKKTAAQFAVANGISPEVIGRMVPSIGTYQKVKTADDVAGQLGIIHKMGVEAVGKFSPLMKVYNKLAPTMIKPGGGGAVKSAGELMGVISATSPESGQESAITQMLNQAWDTMAVAQNDDQAKAFQKMGIVPGKTDFLGGLEGFKKLIDEGADRGENAETTLFNAGFHRKSANRAISKAVTMIDVFRKNAIATAGAGDASAVYDANAKFKAENPDRFAEASVDAARQERGKNNADLDVARRFVLAGLTKRNLVDKPGTNFIEGLHDHTLGYLGAAPLREKNEDTIIRGRLKGLIPGIESRFENFDSAQGEDLGKIIQQLSPDEKALLMKNLEGFAGTGFGKVAAKSGGIAGPGGEAVAFDPEAKKLLKDGVEATKETNKLLAAALGGSPRPVPATRMGPLGVDSPSGSAMRT